MTGAPFLPRLLWLGLCLAGGNAWPHTAWARWCAIQPPSMQGSGDSTALVVSVACDDAPGPNRVQYPNGQLHLGATAVKLPARLARDVAGGRVGYDVEVYQDLPAVSLPKDLPAGQTSVAIKAGNLKSFSHIVLAVWSKKESCGADDVSDTDRGNGCLLYKYRFNNVDDEEYPAPVDAWPRPNCNVAALRQAGFFKAGKDPASLPRRFAGLARLNDCWNLVPGPGLGFSITRWRFAPLSNLANMP